MQELQEIDLIVACFEPSVAAMAKSNMEYLRSKYFGMTDYEKLLKIVDSKYELISQDGYTDIVFKNDLISLGYTPDIIGIMLQAYEKMRNYTEDELHAVKTALSNVITNEAINKCQRENFSSPIDFVRAIQGFNVDNIQDVDKRIYREFTLFDIDVSKLKAEVVGSALKSSLPMLNSCSPLGGYLDRTLTMVSGKPGCFTGDTKVMMVDGSYKTMKELHVSGAKDIPVFSYNENTGHVYITTAKECRLMKTVTKLIKVTLDNGYEISCTPDHLFRTVNAFYVPACELQIGTALLPLHKSIELTGTQKTSRDPNCLPEYESVYTTVNKHSHNKFTHQLVGDFIYPDRVAEGRTVCHHKDLNKLNNAIDNIQVLKPCEHSKIHSRINWDTQYERFVQVSINNLPENARDDITLEAIENCARKFHATSNAHIAALLGCSTTVVGVRIKEKYPSAIDFRKAMGLPLRRTKYFNVIPKDTLVAAGKQCNVVTIDALYNILGSQYTRSEISTSVETHFKDLRNFARIYDCRFHWTHGNAPTVREVIVGVLRGGKVDWAKSTTERRLKTCDLTKTKLKQLRDLITIDRLREVLHNTASIVDTANQFNVKPVVIEGFMEYYSIKLKDVCDDYENHTVAKIEVIILDQPVEVFDLIEAGAFHNFAIKADDMPEHADSGVFVHNSGKSMLLTQEACEFARQGKKVLYLALGDMNEYHFVTRIFAQQYRVSMNKVALTFDTLMMQARNDPGMSWIPNLKIQCFQPDQISCTNWISFIKSKGFYDEYDVFIADYDSNFSSEEDMYQKGETTYNQLKGLSDRPGKWVFIACQPKPNYYSEEILPLESGNESSRKQQIVDNMITVSFPPIKGGQNHIGIINVPKYRGGMLASTPYLMDKNGRFEEISMPLYSWLKICPDPVTLPGSGCSDMSKEIDLNNIPQIKK